MKAIEERLKQNQKRARYPACLFNAELIRLNANYINLTVRGILLVYDEAYAEQHPDEWASFQERFHARFPRFRQSWDDAIPSTYRRTYPTLAAPGRRRGSNGSIRHPGCARRFLGLDGHRCGRRFTGKSKNTFLLSYESTNQTNHRTHRT